MKNYVLGFAFTGFDNDVVLIKKNRPTWQAGKLNGVGGKIEPHELPTSAMIREFKEETGVKTNNSDWTHVATLEENNEFTIDVFTASSDRFYKCKSKTDEEVVVMPMSTFYVNYLSSFVSNVPWLVNLCLDPDLHYGSTFLHIEYQRVEETK